MNAVQFWEKLASVQAASGAYLAAESGWVGIWVNFMMLVLLSSLILMFKFKEARWIALSIVYLMIITPIINMATDGPTRFWGVSHILCWTPIVVYLVTRLVKGGLQGWYPKWMLLVAATMTTSLVFDVYDLYRFFST